MTEPNDEKSNDIEPVDGALRALFQGSDESDDRTSFRLSAFRVGPQAAGDEAGDGTSRRLGRYEVVREIARGGVGVVLEARDSELGRRIAVKVLRDRHAASSEIRRRLVEEAQIGGQLEHPGIVPVHELGVDDHQGPYLAMKLVQGQTLTEVLKARSSPDVDRQKLIGIFSRVCQAMAYAHSRGVIHRDLKPHNLAVGEFGEVQIMDWGLAKTQRASTDESARNDRVETYRTDRPLADSLVGTVMGTPAYMPPEQAAGEVDALDARADVFSLGAILCEILTGAPPYTGRTSGEVLARSRQADLADARRRLGECGADPELLALTRKCLAVDPEDRPTDASELATTVEDYLASLEERRRAAELEATEAHVREIGARKARRLTLLLASSIVLGTLATGGGYLVVERGRRERVRGLEQDLTAAIERASSRHDRAAAAGFLDVAPWDAALEAANAARVLASDEVDTSLRTRAIDLATTIERTRNTASLLRELDGARGQLATGADARRAHERFRRAFADLVDESSPAAIDRTIERIHATGAPIELAHYLDQWSRLKRRLGHDPSPLSAILRAIDPDPWRSRLRAALDARDIATLEKLGGDPDAARSVADLDLLASALHRAGALDVAKRIWLRAWAEKPDDFWACIGLAVVARQSRPPQHDESLRWLSVACTARPDSVFATKLLADDLRQAKRFDEANEILTAAISSRPREPEFHVYRSRLLFDTGDLDAAEASARRVLELADETAEPTATRASGLRSLVLVQLKRRQNQEARSLAMQAVELEPAHPLNHDLHGRCLVKLGRIDEALQSFGKALELDPAIRRYLVAGDALNDAGAVDAAARVIAAALQAWPDDLELLLEMGRAHSANADGGAGWYVLAARQAPDSVRALGGLAMALRQVERIDDELAASVREVLSSVPQALEAHGAVAELRRRFPARETTSVPPEPPRPTLQPRNLSPPRGATLAGGSVELQASPFYHPSSDVTHLGTLWELRDSEGSYDLTPTLVLYTAESKTRLTLAMGRLLPGRSYVWRVTYVGSNLTPLPTSEETSFVVPPQDQEIISVDLESLFNRDIVASAADDAGDGLDDSGGLLVVDGFDGTAEPSSESRGLPRDRRIGAHVLAPYDGPNAIHLAPSAEPVVIDLPRGRYHALRFLVTGGDGRTDAPLELSFADGTSATRQLACDDWFEDPPPHGRLREDATPVWNGMDRMYDGKWENRDDAAVFEHVVLVDASKVLVSVKLDMPRAHFASPKTRCNILALTGLRQP